MPEAEPDQLGALTGGTGGSQGCEFRKCRGACFDVRPADVLEVRLRICHEVPVAREIEEQCFVRKALA
jgi:hypothetical protein